MYPLPQQYTRFAVQHELPSSPRHNQMTNPDVRRAKESLSEAVKAMRERESQQGSLRKGA